MACATASCSMIATMKRVRRIVSAEKASRVTRYVALRVYGVNEAQWLLLALRSHNDVAVHVAICGESGRWKSFIPAERLPSR